MNLPHDSDDLSRHAPVLFKLKGTETGFHVPSLYFEELSERVISMTSIPEEGGLVVPENYFEELPALIEAKTFIPSEDGLTVPENYFEELPSIIEAKTALPAEDGLQIPGNYFEEFTSQLESRIELESVLPKEKEDVPPSYFAAMESELQVHIALDNIKQDEGFVVPGNYFANLTERVLAETSLAGEVINDDEVPAGYFDTLHDKVAERIESEKQPERGRVIMLPGFMKKYGRPLAIAASAALIITLGWIFMNNGNENPNPNFMAGRDSVPPRVIHAFPVIGDTLYMQETPKGIAGQGPKKPEGIKPKLDPEVIVNEEEIIAQSDLMDESMVMDFVMENEAIKPSEEVLDKSMMEYLLNDNTGLDVFGPGDKKP